MGKENGVALLASQTLLFDIKQVLNAELRLDLPQLSHGLLDQRLQRSLLTLQVQHRLTSTLPACPRPVAFQDRGSRVWVAVQLDEIRRDGADHPVQPILEPLVALSTLWPVSNQLSREFNRLTEGSLRENIGIDLVTAINPLPVRVLNDDGPEDGRPLLYLAIPVGGLDR